MNAVGPIPATAPLADAAGIRISGLNQKFVKPDGEAVQALNDVSLDINPGEFVSIVGPSGCGKTTLLNMIAALEPLQSGELEVLGAPPKKGRKDIAYMFARDCLLPWRSAQANVEYGLQLHHKPKAQRRSVAIAWLKKVGLAGFESSYPHQLSHGMRQRAALARTFALDAPLLLMDEPFGALDAQTKMALEAALLSIWETSEQRKTVVFVTHDLAEAVLLSDRVIVMASRPGRIVADVRVDLPRPRNVDDLQSDPKYHEYYSELWERLRHKSSGAHRAEGAH